MKLNACPTKTILAKTSRAPRRNQRTWSRARLCPFQLARVRRRSQDRIFGTTSTLHAAQNNCIRPELCGCLKRTAASVRPHRPRRSDSQTPPPLPCEMHARHPSTAAFSLDPIIRRLFLFLIVFESRGNGTCGPWIYWRALWP